eukprot:scaffold33456_cov96-Isochrysis_galbana.AAC.1
MIGRTTGDRPAPQQQTACYPSGTGASPHSCPLPPAPHARCNATGWAMGEHIRVTWLSVFAEAAHRKVPPSVAVSSAGSSGA